MTSRARTWCLISSILVAACDAGVVAERDGGATDRDAPRPMPDTGPVCAPSGTSESACTGAVDEDCDGRIDCADSDCDGMTCLAGATCMAGGCVPTGIFPDAPPLAGVRATVDGDRVHVTFEPTLGARDYRIYPLPAEGSVSIDADGYQWIEGATYRCGGDRETQSTGYSLVDTVFNFDRTEADATLGHVFQEPGAGRVPVYRLGDPSTEPIASGSCWVSWNATRSAVFTSDEAERTTLLAAGWRDDGIQFYAPASGSAGTEPVYFDTTIDYEHAGAFGAPRNLFYVAGAEHDARGEASELVRRVAFDVLTAPTTGSVPLLRVFYRPTCGTVHDELAAGEARFERILRQGNQPLWEVQWSGLTGPITLVVEALDAGCPFQGHLSHADVPERDGAYAQAFATIDTVRAAAMHGEVFLNGQHDPSSRPRPIARSFVDVAPNARPAMDFQHGFSPSDPVETFSIVRTESHGGDDVYLESETFTAELYALEPGFGAIGVVGGELWVSYADWGADVGAMARITPRQLATMSASSYVHATMAVDVWATGRRYPQIFISSAMAPVQENLAGATTINVEPIQGWPTLLEIQLCDHRIWAVNDQCPVFDTDETEFDDPMPAPPRDLMGEHAGVMRLARVDVWASTQRVYVLIDGMPWACAELPAGAFPEGPATVTFGDVLYHSGVDEAVVEPDSAYAFHREHMLTETRRVFDNLGFESGEGEPVWNEHIPCTAAFR